MLPLFTFAKKTMKEESIFFAFGSFIVKNQRRPGEARAGTPQALHRLFQTRKKTLNGVLWGSQKKIRHH